MESKEILTKFVNETTQFHDQLITKAFGRSQIPVTMHKESEYFWVNATCKAFNTEWRAFAKSQKNGEFIDVVARRLQIPREGKVPPFFTLGTKRTNVRLEQPAVVHTVRDNVGALSQFRGTWVHRYVFLNMAEWLDQEFHLDVVMWFDEGMHGKSPEALPYMSESVKILKHYNQVMMNPEAQVALAKRDAAITARKAFGEKGYYARNDFKENATEKFYAYAADGMTMKAYKAQALAAGWNKSQVDSFIKSMRNVHPHRGSAYSFETALVDQGFPIKDAREVAQWSIKFFEKIWLKDLSRGIDQRIPPRGKRLSIEEVRQKMKTKKRKKTKLLT